MLKRKIHIIGLVSLVFLYISLGLMINAYIQTHGQNLKTISQNNLRIQWLITIISALVLVTAATFVLGSGINLLIKIERANPQYRTLNIVTGIIYILGGLGIGIFLSIYLYFNE